MLIGKQNFGPIDQVILAERKACAEAGLSPEETRERVIEARNRFLLAARAEQRLEAEST